MTKGHTMPTTNQPPATPASDAQCPKCGSSTFMAYDADNRDYECGSGHCHHVGFTQSDKCRIAELTAENARLQAALAESKPALIDCRDYMDGKTTDPVQAIVSVRRVLKKLAANEIRSVTP